MLIEFASVCCHQADDFGLHCSNGWYKWSPFVCKDTRNFSWLRFFVWAPLLLLPVVIPRPTYPCLGSRDSECPTSEASSLTNLGVCEDICFSRQNSDCHLLFATVTASWLETTSAGWHCNYTLWQWLIGIWEMGLKGFLGIRTGSCCMTNKHCERWAAEQMQLTHIPIDCTHTSR